MFADEALTVTPDFHKGAGPSAPGASVEYIPHTELKERSKDARPLCLPVNLPGTPT